MLMTQAGLLSSGSIVTLPPHREPLLLPSPPGDPPRSADRLGPDFYEVTTSALGPGV